MAAVARIRNPRNTNKLSGKDTNNAKAADMKIGTYAPMITATVWIIKVKTTNKPKRAST